MVLNKSGKKYFGRSLRQSPPTEEVAGLRRWAECPSRRNATEQVTLAPLECGNFDYKSLDSRDFSLPPSRLGMGVPVVVGENQKQILA